jgi:hypothetical protein
VNKGCSSRGRARRLHISVRDLMLPVTREEVRVAARKPVSLLGHLLGTGGASGATGYPEHGNKKKGVAHVGCAFSTLSVATGLPIGHGCRTDAGGLRERSS